MVERKFYYYRNKILTNEQNLLKTELTLPKYYSKISEELRDYQSSELCQLVKDKNPEFPLDGCQNDCKQLLMRGLRESLTIISINIHKLYKAYEYDTDHSKENIIKTYINDLDVTNIGFINNNL